MTTLPEATHEIVLHANREAAPAPRGRRFPLRLTFSWPLIALLAITLLAAGLRLVNIDSIGDGNAYYTAAVKNMLQSPSNFFYAVADAGNVTVDKPPVALWIQAIFAAVLGVSGFAVTLPSILAGTFSAPVLYHLVQKWAGKTAGLIAAFVLAVTPVAVAVDRTNNLDSLLIFTLLLATWAFIRATETGRWRHLLLGAVLIGVGFNIKMLQAYLIVPALYGLYLLGASVAWRKKILQMAVTGIVMLAVSLSWALAVELTPADQRPYVGGSESNSVIELALGYNGLQRLLGMQMGGTSAARPDDGASDGATDDRVRPDGGGMPSFAPGGSGEVGEPGLTRFFTQPLVNELSWLLSFGLFGVAALALSRRVRLPLDRPHQMVVLWGGWLGIGVAYFSVSEFFHAYYLATLAPALAALVGITSVWLWGRWQANRYLALALTAGVVGGTLAFQITTVSGFTVAFGVPAVLIGLAGLIGLVAALRSLRTNTLRWRTVAVAGLVAAILITPAYWGLNTALGGNGNNVLPAAYEGSSTASRVAGMPFDGDTNIGQNAGQSADSTLADYLESHAGTERYLIAVGSSMSGTSLVLDTDISVMYLGGFNGQDSIHTAESIAALVEAGELRYVLTSGGMMGGMNAGSSDVTSWVTAHCSVVEGVSVTANGGLPGMPDDGAGGFQPPAGMQPPNGGVAGAVMGLIVGAASASTALYDCGALAASQGNAG